MKIPEIKKTAVLGGGLIGSSWATNFIWKGVSVQMKLVAQLEPMRPPPSTAVFLFWGIFMH